jgi:hypothetical protein
VAGGRQRRTAGKNAAAAYLPGGARASSGKQLRRGVEELQEDTRTRRGVERGHEEGQRRARGSGHDGETGSAQRRNGDALRFVPLTADDKLRDTRESRTPRGLGRGQVAIRMCSTRAGVYWRVARGLGRLVLLYGRSARETDGAEGPRRCRSTAEVPKRPYAGGIGGRHVAGAARTAPRSGARVPARRQFSFRSACFEIA